MNTQFPIPATSHFVADNDLKVLEEIAQFSSISQRDLAVRSGLSLGMVNLVLKRLIKTGYIQIQNLHKRKMVYFLTPQGISAKSRRAYEYLSRTVRIYETYRKSINTMINEQLANGRNKFVVHGEGDIVDLVELVLAGRTDTLHYRVCPSHQAAQPQPDEVLLVCFLPDKTPILGISILETILSQSTLSAINPKMGLEQVKKSC